MVTPDDEGMSDNKSIAQSYYFWELPAANDSVPHDIPTILILAALDLD